MAESETRVSRDTRLLILVIAVAVVVLFVLAQFRFPEAEVSLSTVTPAGLDRLAAQSNYGELASAVRTTLQGVEASVMVFDIEGVPDGSKQAAQRRTQVIRLHDGLAIGPAPAGFKVLRASAGANVPLIRIHDPSRGVLIAALTSENPPTRTANLVADFEGYAYVAVVEPARGGPTATPMFIGRVDTQYDPRWGAELVATGGSSALPVGGFVFLLDGRFVGMVVNVPNGPSAIAPAALLMAFLESPESAGGSSTGAQR
jgi:hypothetical protein